MTNAEKFIEMLKMQETTDNLIFMKMQMLNVPQPADYKLAILDEVGELNHELKGKWCWWQETPKPIVRDRVREELVDIWHFCLSYMIHHVRFDYEEFARDLNYGQLDFYDPINFLNRFEVAIMGQTSMKAALEHLIGIGNYLGIDFGAVYETYKKKNEENNERAKSTY